MNNNLRNYWLGLSLHEALFLGFCSVMILVTKAALRLHLKIPGHSMFFLIFFLLLAGICVKKSWTASIAGSLAGIQAVMLGMGKGGPLLLLKFLLPGLTIDLGLLLLPMASTQVWACLAIAFMSGLTRIFSTVLTDWLVGVDKSILIGHALIQTGGGIFFGMLGSLPVPSIVKKLQARGLLAD